MSFDGGETSEAVEEALEMTCAQTDEIKIPEKAESQHAKPKRRRRGKKRKHRKESSSGLENEGDLPPTWDSDEDLSGETGTFTNVVIRPINVPKAPENSTQFIMDDHDECRLYMSFETPNPYLTDPPHLDGEDYVIIEPIGEDAAYQDIDYQYESPQDFDNSAYYDREFELSYNNNRYEELMHLSRNDLISALETLEFRLRDLEEDFVKHNPSPVLEKLQSELLNLQEENTMLKECNSKLNVLLIKNETDESISEQSHDEDMQTVKVMNSENDQLQDLHIDFPSNKLPSLETVSYELSDKGCVCEDEIDSRDDKLCVVHKAGSSKQSCELSSTGCVCEEEIPLDSRDNKLCLVHNAGSSYQSYELFSKDCVCEDEMPLDSHDDKLCLVDNTGSTDQLSEAV